ncbi:putative hscarg dehydrogenase [Thozetella sp. PMI_491]|nr:putative hscarg dehydrogenase [Thozetella sp. PMI_491]
MSKVLAVFGATGIQGSSVINNVLSDPELSQKYSLRAIVRDTSSEKANQLKQKNVEVVSGDMANPDSLKTALAGAHTVFIMTIPVWGPDAVQAECNHAKTMADIAVEQGVEYIIFSTLPAVAEFSGGRYTHITPFDAKALAENYIRSLPVKSAFCSFGFFMENFRSQPFLGPQPAPDGTWVLSRPISSKTQFPYLAATKDVGKFVGAILAEPDKYEGTTFCAAQAHYTLEEIVSALAKSSGKTIVFKQITYDEFEKAMPFAPELWSDGMRCNEELGYYGPGSEKLVRWAAERARGRLTTLDEFLATNPLQLS